MEEEKNTIKDTQEMQNENIETNTFNSIEENQFNQNIPEESNEEEYEKTISKYARLFRLTP